MHMFDFTACPEHPIFLAGSWTKKKNLNYCESKREALCEIWSPVEQREALQDSLGLSQQ